MSAAPERIFAKLDTATVYMDGSSPLIARTREFRGGAAYVRADVADEMLEALKMVLQHGRIDNSEERMNVVSAAIAKATGGSYDKE